MPPDPLETVEFPWDTLQALLGGRSAIDIPRLHIFSLAAAEDFLHCYGYAWDNPLHREEIEALREESLGFIERELLSGTGLEMDKEIAAERDVRRLLLKVSGEPQDDAHYWACGLLRVMHTMAHCRSYFNERFGEQIRRQILDRFESHLTLTSTGWSLGRGPMAIPLERFEFKPVKSIYSLALKLLHKPENVAADIFDRVGLRFVTIERFDALLVVKYLAENNVLMFANNKPSRSRNTLIDMDWLQGELARIDEEVRAGRRQRYTALEELRAKVRARPFPSGPEPSYNPYSSIAYHSIQFTCRQLVRVNNPYGGELLVKLAQLGLAGSEEAATMQVARGLESMDEIRFFFPFEVQILDLASYELSRSGLASHSEYKSRQRASVLKRVFGPLMRGARVRPWP